MNIPDTHIPTLRFKISLHAPKSSIDKWKELKDICEYNNNDENKKIVKDWLSFCDNEKIKEMPYLNRCEGGIGGDNNFKHKQMRFLALLFSHFKYNRSKRMFFRLGKVSKLIYSSYKPRR